MRIVFYNHFGNGDIFESREFVKDLMKIIPADEYLYAHGKNPKILRDIPGLKYTEVTDAMLPTRAFIWEKDVIYINTWIGRDGQYVLPGIGCVVEMLFTMYSHMLQMMKLRPLLRGDPFSYIPTIDYSHYNIAPVNDWVDGHSDKLNILVGNGPAQSSQAHNFDFTEGIFAVARLYPTVNLILTSDADIKEENVFFTKDIIPQEDGFDLNEISYLSKFCRISTGRNSGPHVFSQVLDNWNDPTKVNLSFTKERVASHFVLSDDMPMLKMWSGTNHPLGFLSAAEGAIRECLKRG